LPLPLPLPLLLPLPLPYSVDEVLDEVRSRNLICLSLCARAFLNSSSFFGTFKFGCWEEEDEKEEDDEEEDDEEEE